MSNPKDFPASIKIPNGIAEDMTDRTTMPCNTNLAKLAAGMMSSTLICWGVIRRPDRKLAFQFLSLVYNKWLNIWFYNNSFVLNRVFTIF